MKPQRMVLNKGIPMRDRVFATPQPNIVDFAFNEEVVNVFPDMIRRSVPGYELVIPMGGLIAARHMGSNGVAYDLGCSLGASSLALLTYCPSPDIQIIAIDNSKAMIDEAQKHIQDPRIEFRLDDLLKVDITGAKVVMLNFVLQFLDPQHRGELLRRIAQSMDPEGLLILSEKVQDHEPATHGFYDATHLAWKQANGYSELEVSQKRQALENVMRVESPEIHRERLQDCGFNDVIQWFHCLNWVSFAASPIRVLATHE
jgi:tRNA (cmo5U34)-methyltransferase